MIFLLEVEHRRLRLSAHENKWYCGIDCILGEIKRERSVSETDSDGKSGNGNGKGNRKTSGTVGSGTKTSSASNVVERGTLQKTTAKEEVIEEPSMTAIGARASALSGADDNQTKAKETGTEIESMSSTTLNGKKRKTCAKPRTKATNARWETCRHLDCC